MLLGEATLPFALAFALRVCSMEGASCHLVWNCWEYACGLHIEMMGLHACGSWEVEVEAVAACSLSF
jgi:hypothetical protein